MSATIHARPVHTPGSQFRKGLKSTLSTHMKATGLPGKATGHVFGRAVGLLWGAVYVPTAASANLFRSKKHPTKTFWQCTADTAKVFQQAGKRITQTALSPTALVTIPLVGLPIGTAKAVAHKRKMNRKPKAGVAFKLKDDFSAKLRKKKSLAGMWNPLKNADKQFMSLANKLHSSPKADGTLKSWVSSLQSLMRNANSTADTASDRVIKMGTFAGFDEETNQFQVMKSKPKGFLAQMDRFVSQTTDTINDSMKYQKKILEQLATAPKPLQNAAQQLARAYEAIIEETLHRTSLAASQYHFSEEDVDLATKEQLARDFMTNFKLPTS